MIAERGEIPAVTTLRRWGRFCKLESRLEHEYGRDVAECVLHSCAGVHGFTPIAGFPAFTRDGALVPRLGGGQGFSGIADLRAKALAGRMQMFRLDKAGNSVGTIGDSRHLWAKTGPPGQGANAATAAGGGGTNWDNTAIGGLRQREANTGNVNYFLGCQASNTITPMAYIMFDYFWGGNVNWSTGTTPLTPGTPTKYQTTAEAIGVWASTRVTTVLDGTATTVTLHYHDENGTSQALNGLAVTPAAAVHAPIFATSAQSWQFPIFTQGVRDVQSVVLSANPVSGAFDLMMGKNIVCIPSTPRTGDGVTPFGNLMIYLDGWMSAFNFAPIPPTANLAFLEFSKSQAGQSGNSNIENICLVEG